MRMTKLKRVMVVLLVFGIAGAGGWFTYPAAIGQQTKRQRSKEAIVPAAPLPVDEDSRLRKQVMDLEQRVAALEAKLGIQAKTEKDIARVGQIFITGNKKR